MIEENSGEVRNDLFDLNIWWNLNILRDTLKGGGRSNLVLLSPAGRPSLCILALKVLGWRPRIAAAPLSLDAPSGF